MRPFSGPPFVPPRYSAAPRSRPCCGNEGYWSPGSSAEAAGTRAPQYPRAFQHRRRRLQDARAATDAGLAGDVPVRSRVLLLHASVTPARLLLRWTSRRADDWRCANAAGRMRFVRVGGQRDRPGPYLVSEAVTRQTPAWRTKAIARRAVADRARLGRTRTRADAQTAGGGRSRCAVQAERRASVIADLKRPAHCPNTESDFRLRRSWDEWA